MQFARELTDSCAHLGDSSLPVHRPESRHTLNSEVVSYLGEGIDVDLNEIDVFMFSAQIFEEWCDLAARGAPATYQITIQGIERGTLHTAPCRRPRRYLGIYMNSRRVVTSNNPYHEAVK
jgi:hypothetical protein